MFPCYLLIYIDRFLICPIYSRFKFPSSPPHAIIISTRTLHQFCKWNLCVYWLVLFFDLSCVYIKLCSLNNHFFRTKQILSTPLKSNDVFLGKLTAL